MNFHLDGSILIDETSTSTSSNHFVRLDINSAAPANGFIRLILCITGLLSLFCAIISFIVDNSGKDTFTANVQAMPHLMVRP